jgi:hypothetical protein
LRPSRALRSVRENFPNPGSATASSRATAATTVSMKAYSALSASAFERPAPSAILSMSSALFTLLPPSSRASKNSNVSSTECQAFGARTHRVGAANRAVMHDRRTHAYRKKR